MVSIEHWGLAWSREISTIRLSTSRPSTIDHRAWFHMKVDKVALHATKTPRPQCTIKQGRSRGSFRSIKLIRK